MRIIMHDLTPEQWARLSPETREDDVIVGNCGEASMKQLAGAVSARTPIQNLYVQPTCIPRFVYMLAAHRLFRSTGRKNGVKV
ncbi:MAG: hypothetical protein IJE08_09300 [Clostridia bacterium]|nr:hypothetical protein [Clostridia bacterium]